MKNIFTLIGVLILLTTSLSCAKTQQVSQAEITREAPAQIIPPHIVGDSSWKIAIISDMNGSYGSTSYSNAVSSAIQHITASDVAAVLSTGDMVAGQKTGLDYQKMWNAYHAVVTKPLSTSEIPFLPSPGNHDASAGSNFKNERDIYINNWNNFPIERFNSARPDTAKLEFISGVVQNYPLNYAVKMGPAIFISLDATAVGPLINNQLTWLEDVLTKTASAKIKVVFGHVPLYPFTFAKTTEYLAYGTAKTTYAERFETLLETHKVTYYLSGHAHAFYPGHRRGQVRYISVPLLGSGARKILTTTGEGSVSKTSFLYLTFDAQGNHRLEALESPSYKAIPFQSLPSAVSVPRSDSADCQQCSTFPQEFFLTPQARELFYRLDE
jgi:acid phosphatase type 7